MDARDRRHAGIGGPCPFVQRGQGSGVGNQSPNIGNGVIDQVESLIGQFGALSVRQPFLEGEGGRAEQLAPWSMELLSPRAEEDGPERGRTAVLTGELRVDHAKNVAQANERHSMMINTIETVRTTVAAHGT
ncbi:hypothetical protein [Streptomyces prasinopilosus]|uniref:hypothetical protein n=1 Tax=Streptomyces prasinopilosus TaxID=67344 RepID=UPI0024577CCC|nr:hypothetical protein [Streptomyces prasinopilosus]